MVSIILFVLLLSFVLAIMILQSFFQVKNFLQKVENFLSWWDTRITRRSTYSKNHALLDPNNNPRSPAEVRRNVTGQRCYSLGQVRYGDSTGTCPGAEICFQGWFVHYLCWHNVTNYLYKCQYSYCVVVAVQMSSTKTWNSILESDCVIGLYWCREYA